MDMLNVKINGISVSVEKGSTILDAARAAGVEIPTLCFMKEKNEIGACRICVVEANEGRGFRIVTACVYPVSEGMEVLTNTEKIQKARRTTLELILSTHEKKCLSCVRSTNCELQKLCRDYGVEESAFEGFKPTYELDTSTPHLVRDNNKCVLCRRCVAACNEQYVGVIGANNRGIDTAIGTPFEVGLSNVPCISCGQCTVVCPTGALVEKDDTDKIWAALADPDKHVVVQTAPSVRAALGEEFGMPIGTNVEGKMVAALRRLGFDKVFDTDFGADLTIMEEAHELLDRVQNGGKLPLITSCSPGWIKYCEHYFPDMTENLSSCKSPQQMFGAIAKTYYAKVLGVEPERLFVVSVMPCTAKKAECALPSMMGEGGAPDVDVALTVREMVRMIRASHVSVDTLVEEPLDTPLGFGTGAGVIFGATGGVMEAALRTVSALAGGPDLGRIAFEPVRGLATFKEAEVETEAFGKLRIAVVHGMRAADEVIRMVREGRSPYHFVEVMACPGGCVGGGGTVRGIVWRSTLERRQNAVYSTDASMKLRTSHENEDVVRLYRDFLGEPGSPLAHELLHCEYRERERRSEKPDYRTIESAVELASV